MLALGSVDAAAQEKGAIRGVVTDSGGAPIASADVGIRSERTLTRTDESGHFRFDGLRPGALELSVRRLGYNPRTIRVDVTGVELDSVLVVMKQSAAVIAGVSITDQRRREGIEDFYRRRVLGLGTYVSREEIDGRQSGSATDMLRTMPGLRFVNGTRGVRFNSSSIIRRDCMPMIWIDGQRAPGLEVGDVTLTDIEGIELYPGPSTTPMQFSVGSSSHSTCGTIVIWSRQPGGS
jgi:hypothetical protein